MSEQNPEIVKSIGECRELTDRETAIVRLEAMKAVARHWLRWTKEQRAKEGLDCGEYADIQFPFQPSYPQITHWVEAMEHAVAILRADLT